MSEMFADLLAAQKEMPALQKSAINPHFKNKFVPLDELLSTVIPILNAHNFVLMQAPAIWNDAPALTYRLIHSSGEVVGDTMLLMCGKDDPQGQGSAITYARRYSLMSMLGLTADADDDGNKPAPKAKPAAKKEPKAADEHQVKVMFAIHKTLTDDAQMALEGWLKRVQPNSIIEGEPPHFGRIAAEMANRVIEQMEKAPKRDHAPTGADK